MKKRRSGSVFGIVMIVALAWSNLLHLPWSIWLVWEQIETGLGAGTGMEMLALALLTVELLSLPALLAETVFLVLYGFREHSVRGIRCANICLFAGALLQFGLTNLFLRY